MASRNTSAAASNESAIAPLPSSDRPCRTDVWPTSSMRPSGQRDNRLRYSRCQRRLPDGGPDPGSDPECIFLRSSGQLRCRLLLRKRPDTVGEITTRRQKPFVFALWLSKEG